MRLIGIDRAGLEFARTRGHTPGLERGVAAYSRAGEHAACWLALGVAGSLLSRESDRRRAWRRGATIVGVSYGLNQAIKVAVRRRRPQLDGLEPLTPVVTQLSFPSAYRGGGCMAREPAPSSGPEDPPGWGRAIPARPPPESSRPLLSQPPAACGLRSAILRSITPFAETGSVTRRPGTS